VIERVVHWLRWLCVLPIRIYQGTISRITPATCRFKPTCSQYAVEAVQGHGLFKGGWLATWRILRCNPFVEGGWDPVPPVRGAHDGRCASHKSCAPEDNPEGK